MIICFDLDNTICYPIRSSESPEDCLVVKPFPKMLELIKKLKERGHIITIFTRRSETCKINTVKWLKKYEVSYDEITFCKPKYDVLIDDRVITRHRSDFTPELVEVYGNYFSELIQENLKELNEK